MFSLLCCFPSLKRSKKMHRSRKESQDIESKRGSPGRTESTSSLPLTIERRDSNVEPGSKGEENVTTSGTLTTAKNTSILALTIAQNAPVPWLGIVAKTLLEVIERCGNMNMNEKEIRELEESITSFLYIVSSNVKQIEDPLIIEQFKQRVDAIKGSIPKSSNVASKFINASDTQGTLARLREKLDSAVQLLQTSLQISLVRDMKEFKDWRTAMEENKNDGSIIREIMEVTIAAKGNIRLDTEGTGKVKSITSNAEFRTEKSFTRRTQGASVSDILTKSKIVADEDVDLSAIATGTRRF